MEKKREGKRPGGFLLRVKRLTKPDCRSGQGSKKQKPRKKDLKVGTAQEREGREANKIELIDFK